MKPDDLRRRLEKYRESAEMAKRALDTELANVLPRVAVREVERLRHAEADALRLLIVTELFAALQEDSDAVAAWMHECVEAGEVIQRPPAEDAW